MSQDLPHGPPRPVLIDLSLKLSRAQGFEKGYRLRQPLVELDCDRRSPIYHELLNNRYPVLPAGVSFTFARRRDRSGHSYGERFRKG
jgi:hypothetical protein